MSQTCTVCRSPDREAIDRVLLDGGALRDVAGRFKLSKSAVERHKAACLPAFLVAAKAEADQGHGIDLHQQLKAANSLAWQVAKQAKDAGDGLLALQALDRVLKQLDLVAELTEQLDRRPVVNLLVSPEWVRTRSILVGALAAHPKARVAVASALRELEGGHVEPSR